MASKGKFLVIIAFIVLTSFVNGRASPNTRAASGIISRGKNAPMKNWIVSFYFFGNLACLIALDVFLLGQTRKCD